jgi:predicted  nucleic acid-binding Zn-ribbon protein
VSDLQLLQQLQELDLQIEAQSRALHEIEAALGETSELVNARAQVTRLQELLHDQQKRLRDLEWSVEEINRHAREDEEKLYGGKIRNPKELEGLRRDLEQQQTRRREVEDRELELMSDIESTQADLQHAQEEFARVQAAIDARNRDLLERQVEAMQNVSALSADRAKLAAAVASPSLAQYEQLRRDKRGRAVSKIERATCQGCRIALPMGVVARARAGREFVFCPSCGRILYT